MRRVGLLSEEGLSFTRDTWHGVLVDDTMSWPSLHQINVRVIGRLVAAGPGFTADEDRRPVSYVLEHWIFPLSGLDLTMAKVDVDDLKRQRDRWLAGAGHC